MAQNENAVMYAVEQVCGLYGVQVMREQSMRYNVQKANGTWRPIFIGQWTDNCGQIHRAGKADFLARPRISIAPEMLDCRDGIVTPYGTVAGVTVTKRRVSIPLWIECKSLTGRASTEQLFFKKYVEANGDAYLLLREDVRPLIAWFDAHGVEKNCDEVALASVVTPLDSTELYVLPCKYCGFSRALHKGSMFCCPLELAACSTKLIGKVWSPDLRKGARAKAAPQPEVEI